MAAGAAAPGHAGAIANGAAGLGLDGVVWTALPPRYEEEDGRAPGAEEALSYLRQLEGGVRRHAEEYVRRVPEEIRTPYRSLFEAELGWASTGE